MEIILHFFGFCGEPHINMLGLSPFLSYINENIRIVIEILNKGLKPYNLLIPG